MASFSDRLRIVTRTSALALWQAEYVRSQLLRLYPALTIEIIGIKTTGDHLAHDNIPLYKMGGKAVFVKELEQALLNHEADIAVHSLKDVPSALPEGLVLTAFCERESPQDAWVCPQGHTLAAIPPGSKIGTSSLRRLIQLKIRRPDLKYLGIRGNVDTRIRKCQQGEFDAIVLAVAGLVRLNLQRHITSIFSLEDVLPAVGQGALAIESRLEDESTQALVAALDHAPTRVCVQAERMMNAILGGNCQIPVAGYATINENKICLKGRVGDPKRMTTIEAYKELPIAKGHQILGEQVALALIDQGAKTIIEEILGS